MTTVVLVADTHVNSKVALCPPGYVLDDGDSYILSDLQKWFWDKWLETISLVDEQRDGEVITVINGDAVDMDTKNRSNQIITRNTKDVVGMAAEAFDPLLQISSTCHIIRGTESHVGLSGMVESQLAEDIAAAPAEDGNRSSYGLVKTWDGIKFDIAHHIRGGGGRPQNINAITDRLAADTLFAYANRGEKPPDLVIRAHIHRYFDSYSHFWTRGIVLPCWQGPTSYVHSLAPNQIVTAGVVLVYLDGDRHYDVQPILYERRFS